MRALVIAVAFVILLNGCSVEPDSQTSPLPNLLLVTLDTTRADHLSCYGYPRPSSPYLDRLARRSVLFQRAMTQSAATPVSHASILTGLNPYSHKVRVIYAESGFKLPTTVPTLATVLGEAGWNTGAFVSSFTASAFYGFDRGFRSYESPTEKDENPFFVARRPEFMLWNMRTNQRTADDNTRRALNWISQTAEPFFLWVHFWDPHDTIFKPELSLQRRFISGSRGRAIHEHDIYDAEIYEVDSQLGRLLAQLDEQGLSDRTVVCVVADHGQGLGDHGWEGHNLLYGEQLSSPLLLSGPGLEAGRSVSPLVRTIDLYPTLLELLGQDYTDPVEGESLLPLCRGEATAPRPGYAEALNLYDVNAIMIRERPKDDLLYCAEENGWKLIYRQIRPDESELYRVNADPGELVNLYSVSTAKAEDLLAILNESNVFAEGPFGDADDPLVFERLRALGYVE